MKHSGGSWSEGFERNLILFNFEAPASKGKWRLRPVWGCSSAGRAPALHAGGQEFDPPHLHQRRRGKKAAELTTDGLIAQVVRAHA